MADAFYLTASDLRAIKDLVRRNRGGRGSQQPPARRRRGQQPDDSSPNRPGKVTTQITAATGPAEGNWGVGSVQFYKPNGDADGAPQSVRNSYPTSFDVNVGVVIDVKHSPKLVVGGSCTTYPS